MPDGAFSRSALPDARPRFPRETKCRLLGGPPTPAGMAATGFSFAGRPPRASGGPAGSWTDPANLPEGPAGAHGKNLSMAWKESYSFMARSFQPGGGHPSERAEDCPHLRQGSVLSVQGMFSLPARGMWQPVMIHPGSRALKGGHKARPYESAGTSWGGAGFIPARQAPHSSRSHEGMPAPRAGGLGVRFLPKRTWRDTRRHGRPTVREEGEELRAPARTAAGPLSWRDCCSSSAASAHPETRAETTERPATSWASAVPRCERRSTTTAFPP